MVRKGHTRRDCCQAATSGCAGRARAGGGQALPTEVPRMRSACLRSLACSPTPTGPAHHANRGAQADAALTFTLDHSVGADQSPTRPLPSRSIWPRSRCRGGCSGWFCRSSPACWHRPHRHERAGNVALERWTGEVRLVGGGAGRSCAIWRVMRQFDRPRSRQQAIFAAEHAISVVGSSRKADSGRNNTEYPRNVG